MLEEEIVRVGRMCSIKFESFPKFLCALFHSFLPVEVQGLGSWAREKKGTEKNRYKYRAQCGLILPLMATERDSEHEGGLSCRRGGGKCTKSTATWPINTAQWWHVISGPWRIEDCSYFTLARSFHPIQDTTPVEIDGIDWNSTNH